MFVAPTAAQAEFVQIAWPVLGADTFFSRSFLRHLRVRVREDLSARLLSARLLSARLLIDFLSTFIEYLDRLNESPVVFNWQYGWNSSIGS